MPSTRFSPQAAGPGERSGVMGRENESWSPGWMDEKSRQTLPRGSSKKKKLFSQKLRLVAEALVAMPIAYPALSAGDLLGERNQETRYITVHRLL